MRLNKYISETGVCSRREADKWIAAGRVTCNGQSAVLGTQVAEGDAVRVDGELIGAKKQQIYIALNKPVGIICTTETHIADNIIEHVGFRGVDSPHEQRRYRQRNPAFGEQSRERIPGHRGPSHHRSCLEHDGERREDHG